MRFVRACVCVCSVVVFCGVWCGVCVGGGGGGFTPTLLLQRFQDEDPDFSRDADGDGVNRQCVE